MAASVQSQPPKPPPPPPKVEAAPKPAAEAKPTAQASPAPAPRPAQTPDLFETASGGGRALPTNGESSFSPAVGAAQNQIRDAVGSTVQSAFGGVQSDLQSTLGSVNDAARQNGATGFQLGRDPAGFGGFSDQPLGDMTQLGDMGNLTGGGPGRTDLPSVFMSTGGAAGGVGDRTQVLNLSDTFSRNFGNPNGFGYGGFLDSNAGGGSKPGIGGGTDYLSVLGGGGAPSFATTTTTQPAPSTQTTSNDSGRGSPFPFSFDFGFGNNGNHLGLFNFGSARGGGGGAAGGVADRSGW